LHTLFWEVMRAARFTCLQPVSYEVWTEHFLYIIWLHFRLQYSGPFCDPGRVRVTFLLDKVAHRPVFLGVVCFTLSVSFNRCLLLTFVLLQCYSHRTYKRAKSDNIQETSIRSEIGEDLIEKFFQSQVLKS
jgi:hypothetical protein